MNNFKEKYSNLVQKNTGSDIIQKWRTKQDSLIEYLENFQDKSNIKILELGSGRGFLVKELTKQGFNIDGSDFNPQNILLAREINGIVLNEIDAENINLQDNSYNIVVSSELIEHLPKLERHFDEVKRILKPKGFYIFSTPNLIVERLFNFFSRKNDDLHVSSQSHKTLKKKLENQGFDVSFIKMKKLTLGQKSKIGFLHFLYPVKTLPKIFQPSIICIAKVNK